MHALATPVQQPHMRSIVREREIMVGGEEWRQHHTLKQQLLDLSNHLKNCRTLQNRGQHLFHTKTFKNGEFLCSRGCKVEKLAKMWWCDFREQDLRQVILLCINCRYNAVHLFFDLEHWPSYWTPKRDWMMAMNSRIFQFLQNSPLHLHQVAYS